MFYLMYYFFSKHNWINFIKCTCVLFIFHGTPGQLQGHKMAGAGSNLISMSCASHTEEHNGGWAIICKRWFVLYVW